MIQPTQAFQIPLGVLFHHQQDNELLHHLHNLLHQGDLFVKIIDSSQKSLNNIFHSVHNLIEKVTEIQYLNLMKYRCISIRPNRGFWGSESRRIL